MICDNFFLPRKGASCVSLMILACFITVFISFLAYYLSLIKPSGMVSVTTLISADYQMESAIIMQMQKYRENKSNEPKSFEKEIMLGINMVVKCIKQPNNEYLFEAVVNGRNIHRQIKVKGCSEIPDKLIFLE